MYYGCVTIGKKALNVRVDQELFDKVQNSRHKSNTECVEAALKQYFGDTKARENTQSNDERVQDLKDYIETLKLQLEQKDNQIQNLSYSLNSVSHRLNTIEQEEEKPRLLDKLKFWK